MWVKTFVSHLFIYQESVCDVFCNKCVNKSGIIRSVQHVQVVNRALICDVSARRCCNLVENRESISHGTIGFRCYHVQSGAFRRHALAFCHKFQVVYYILDSDAVKVVNLTARENRWQDFVLFRCCEDKNHVTWRLFQCFEERVESRNGKHVNLVYDKDAVFSVCGRDKHLVAKQSDIFHSIVWCGVKFYNVQRTTFVKSLAWVALVAGVTVGCGVLTVDSLRKNSGTWCLAHTARAAEEVSVCESPCCNGVPERQSERLLPYNGVKRWGAVFSGWY